MRTLARAAGWLLVFVIGTMFLWSCLFLAYIGGRPQ